MPYAWGLSGPHLVLFKSLGLFSKGLSLFSRLDFSRGALLLLKCFSWMQLANISSNWHKFLSIQIQSKTSSTRSKSKPSLGPFLSKFLKQQNLEFNVVIPFGDKAIVSLTYHPDVQELIQELNSTE